MYQIILSISGLYIKLLKVKIQLNKHSLQLYFEDFYIMVYICNAQTEKNILLW